MIKIEVEKSTRKVDLDRTIIGNDLENLQDELEFSFKDEFVDGAGRLDYELPNGDKGYIPLTKVGETYTIPLRNILMKEGFVHFQIVITQVEIEEEIPVFKSNTFYFIVSRSINAEEEAPDDYQTWIDLFEEKIAEVENLNIDAERVEDGVKVVLIKKDRTTKEVVVNDGEQGPQGPKGDDGESYDDTEVWNAINDKEIKSYYVTATLTGTNPFTAVFDKTFNEILEAYNQGRSIYLVIPSINNTTFRLASYQTNTRFYWENVVYYGNKNYYLVVMLNTNNEVQIIMTELADKEYVDNAITQINAIIEELQRHL